MRTFVFFGMLGYMLYQLPGMGTYAFLLGLAAIVPFLLVYYNHKIVEKKSPGLIGVLIALLTYLIGPVAIHQPAWFVVLFGVSILFVLHSKGRIRRFTDRLETGEVVTVCKFLAIALVILPLIPAAVPAEHPVGRLFALLPVTPRQIWMAVVITTSISYLGYGLQTYVLPKKGLLLTGLIGGMYSSTVTVLVLAKQTRRQPSLEREASASILLAISMMYLRILMLVAIFRFHDALKVGPALVLFAALAAGYSLWISRTAPVPAAAGPGPLPGEAAASAPLPEAGGAKPLPASEPVALASSESALHKNPLELNSALLFAFLFVVVSVATKYVLYYYKDMGLRMLSFVVGFSDITPFVVSVLQGNLSIGSHQILQAIIIASASNNLLKAGYVYLFGTRKAGNLVAAGMGALAILTALYVMVVMH